MHTFRLVCVMVLLSTHLKAALTARWELFADRSRDRMRACDWVYESPWSLAAIVADATQVSHRGNSLFVELEDDTDKAAPWQPSPQRELPAPRSQSPRKDRRDVLAQSLKDKSAEPREAGIGPLRDTACQQGAKERSWQLGGARERRRLGLVREFAGGLGEPLDVRPRPVWARPRSRRTHADNGNYPVVRGRVSASSQTPRYSKCLSRCRTLLSTSSRCAAAPRARRTSRAGACPCCGPYQGLTAIPMPECRYRGPSRPNPGAPVNFTCATRRAPYHQSRLPGALRTPSLIAKTHCGTQIKRPASCTTLSYTPITWFVLTSTRSRRLRESQLSHAGWI